MAAELPYASQSTTTPSKQAVSAVDAIKSVLAPLASLKLTVALLVIAIIVTFIGTLEQTRADIHTIKSKYFLENQIFIEVPLKVFLVPAWFPNHQNVSGSIWIPSGMTILALMILNMGTAHLIRFRLQARGSRLIVGLLIATVAALFTWAIIFNAQNPRGLQGEPPIPWHQMRIAFQIVILGIACAAAFGFSVLSAERKYEKLFLAVTAALFGGGLLLTFLFPGTGLINDSAMRIVWQLGQSTAAAAIGLVACILLFKRKGGIVLLHLGVLGLMANELYVNFTNVEQRMTFAEGETSNVAIDVRSVELAVVDSTAPEFDRMVVIPQSKLLSGQMISDDQLPVDLKVIQFLPNSRVNPSPGGNDSLATKGIGMQVEATEMPEITGVDSARVNIASAYVQVFEKGSGKSLGIFLVSQHFGTRMIDLNRVASGEKEFAIDLRFKTEYKPYSIMLKNAEAEYYLGTSTPKYFSSDIVFNDPSNQYQFEHHIWMNNPMRYGGETFYQTGYDSDPVTGKVFSTLQVVKNRGWMIPYVCCMFTVVGLLIQFGGTLLGYLEKKDKSGSATVENADRGMWVARGVFALFAMYVIGQAVSASFGQVKKDEFRLDLLGQIPVTKNGRVQPLDSVARHTVLQLNKRETVNNTAEIKQPAIRWLADTMFDAPGYDQYRLFRIEDNEVLSAIGLPFPMPTPERQAKSNLRYTLSELYDARAKTRELLAGDPKDWKPLQESVAKLVHKQQQVISLEAVLGDQRFDRLSVTRQVESAETQANSSLIPLVVPTDRPDQPWVSLPALRNRLWLKQLAETYKAQTISELARALVEKEYIPAQRELLIKSRMIETILGSNELFELVAQQFGTHDRPTLEKIISDRWNQIPEEDTKKLRDMAQPFADAVIANRLAEFEREMASSLITINGGTSEFMQEDLPEHIASLSKLQPAYLSGDAQTFNQTLIDYLAVIQSSPSNGLSPLSLATEGWYNRFAPFFLATVLYTVAMVIAMAGWLGFSVPLNRLAAWLLWLGVAVHVVGLIARIVISGRPPVTNLYSSFLFVSLVFVIGMLILERLAKLRVGYFLGGAGGFLGLLAAWNMTITDGDTFSVLVAVLDTQFWLATHVVTIAVGYSATMLAGFLGLAYVFRALLTTSLTKEKSRAFASMIYGTVCFGLLTSFFGTVLGGLWGDDSWGRFWGWDPKENGALMIVLWNAVILHARWGGMVRERGMALLAIIGNVITLWSWKGVNVLGVGLHAYAGTEDKALQYIVLFGLFSLLVVVIGLLPKKLWLSYR